MHNHTETPRLRQNSQNLSHRQEPRQNAAAENVSSYIPFPHETEQAGHVALLPEERLSSLSIEHSREKFSKDSFKASNEEQMSDDFYSKSATRLSSRSASFRASDTKKEKRASTVYEDEHESGLKQRLDHSKGLRPIYSLSVAYTPAFRYFSSIWWIHVVSVTCRILLGLALLVVILLFPIKDSDSLLAERDAFIASEFVQVVLGSISAILIFISGCLGAIFLWKIQHNVKAGALLYWTETIGVRFALGASFLVLMIHSTELLMSSESFCGLSTEKIVSSSTTKTTKLAASICVPLSALSVIASAAITVLWVGKTFKVYTIVSYIRFWMGVACLCSAINTFCRLALTRFHVAALKNFDQQTQIQFDLMSNIAIGYTYSCAALSIIGSIYSICTSYRRSAILMSLDVIFVFVVFWILLAFGFGMNWAYSIASYLEDYKLVDIKKKVVVGSVLNSGFKSHLTTILIYISISTFAHVVAFCVSLFSVLVAKCRPTEWTIKERLNRSMLRSEPNTGLTPLISGYQSVRNTSSRLF